MVRESIPLKLGSTMGMKYHLSLQDISNALPPFYTNQM